MLTLGVALTTESSPLEDTTMHLHDHTLIQYWQQYITVQLMEGSIYIHLVGQVEK